MRGTLSRRHSQTLSQTDAVLERTHRGAIVVGAAMAKLSRRPGATRRSGVPATEAHADVWKPYAPHENLSSDDGWEGNDALSTRGATVCPSVASQALLPSQRAAEPSRAALRRNELGCLILASRDGCSYQMWWIIRIYLPDRIRVCFHTISVFAHRFLGSHAAHHILSRLCKDCPSPLPRPHPAPIGSEESGITSRSRTVQRRLVNPTAIAGVR
jgi:hypothetical protein